MIRAFALLLPLAACSAAPTAAGARLPIRDAAALERALAGVRGGETLLLAPGDYGALAIRKRSFPQPVVLQSATPGAARFGRISLLEVEGVTFQDVAVAGVLGDGDSDRTRFVEVRASARIVFQGGEIGGTADGNMLNDGIGMGVRASRDVTVRGLRFHDLNRGAVFAQSTGLRVSDNRVDTMRSDGFDFAGVQDVRIERNSFRDFFYSAERRDHPDFIQFWFRNAGASADVVIADNVMIEGRGQFAQGIFIDNKNGARDVFGDPFRRFTIVNNLYYGSSVHGISFAGGEDSVIERNTALLRPGGIRRTGVNVRRGQRVTVRGNIACGFGGDPAPKGGPRPPRDAAPPDNVLVQCRARDPGVPPERLFGRLPDIETATAAMLVPRGVSAGWRPPVERR